MDRSKCALYIAVVLVLVLARLESCNGGRQPTTELTATSTISLWEPTVVVASLYDPVALAETIHQLSILPNAIVYYVSSKRRLDRPHEAFATEIARTVQ